ncbi:hypothetical protein EOI86_14275 [Hwanghaeella grinnelliae]|uniref:Uncharacterized protein n=1 Tax=Hwanghaeella grinnelliae TaxID=2500179 RepID=A0A437QPB3_9PROT|nr:hypothetical protein [Hwanghaeella grinnelliae]RVU36371.1 hypothetical protein EOI86_14275 [Hwanghaeella grinnelliae]
MTSFGNETQNGMVERFRHPAISPQKRFARRARGVVASLALIAMTSPAIAGTATQACENDIDFKELGASIVVAPSNVDAVPRGERAKAVRFLQSELMVAALACDARQYYGDFVKRYKVSLVSSGRDLKNHFEKAHGQKKGFAELNRFVTRMANKASGRMASLGADFCSNMHATYKHLLSKDDVQLTGFSLGYQARVQGQEQLVAADCDQPQQLSAIPQ